MLINYVTLKTNPVQNILIKRQIQIQGAEQEPINGEKILYCEKMRRTLFYNYVTLKTNLMQNILIKKQIQIQVQNYQLKICPNMKHKK